MKRNVIITALVAVIMAGVGLTYRFLAPPQVPDIKGYSEGQEIRFFHTEASDDKMAQILTGMTGSPVLVVPSLAQASNVLLATVYVFTNGIRDGGPLGFQPDVFDNPPGTPGYSPLRMAFQVTWTNEQTARELKSAAEVKDAAAKGEVTLKRTGVVVNMPFVSWPGGKR